MNTFDVVIAADLRKADETAAGLANDAKQLASAGAAVALAHIPSGAGPDRAFAPPYREILARRIVQLVLPDDSARAKLVVVHTAQSVPAKGLTDATITAQKALVVAAERPKRWPRQGYDVGEVTRGLTSALGAEPTWAPLDPAVRQALVNSKPAVTLTQYDWGDADNRVAHLLNLAGAGKRGTSTALRKTEDVQLPERSHGVLIIDITGDDRPDILLPAVRRETTDVQRPRVVATSAVQAAEHIGDLAVETLPRALATMTDDARRDYLNTRIEGLIRAHEPDDVIVLDDFSTGVDIRELLRTSAAKIWMVQPEGPVDLPAIDDTLGKRVADALPPGWIVAPVSTEFHDDDDGTGSSTVPARPSTSAGLVATAQRRVRSVVAALSRLLRRARRHRPATMPTALIVAPDVHADPGKAVRAIVRRQHETNAFHAAVLAPPDWEPVATEHGLEIETLIPEPTWLSIYGSGWGEYVRQRVRDAGAVFGATTIVFTDNISDDVTVALDVIEASIDATH